MQQIEETSNVIKFMMTPGGSRKTVLPGPARKSLIRGLLEATALSGRTDDGRTRRQRFGLINDRVMECADNRPSVEEVKDT